LPPPGRVKLAMAKSSSRLSSKSSGLELGKKIWKLSDYFKLPILD